MLCPGGGTNVKLTREPRARFFGDDAPYRRVVALQVEGRVVRRQQEERPNIPDPQSLSCPIHYPIAVRREHPRTSNRQRPWRICRERLRVPPLPAALLNRATVECHASRVSTPRLGLHQPCLKVLDVSRQLGALALRGTVLTRPICVATCEHRGGQPDRQRRGHRRHPNHQSAIPPRKLPHPIPPTRRRRHHSLTRQKPLNILREPRRRRVPPPTILVERLHHDPVEVAAQHAG